MELLFATMRKAEELLMEKLHEWKKSMELKGLIKYTLNW